MRFARSPAAALAALPLVVAQTSTDCNPTEKTCPKDIGLNNAAFSSDFTAGESAFASWTAADGTTMNFGSQGAEFTISESGQAPTVQSDFYIFFGRVDVKMKAAPGAGIVSSIVFESDDLDEIDWEFLGGDTTEVETNFFGKGNTTSYDRAVYYPVSSPQTEMHTYTVDWNSDRIEWIIDGKTVRTLSRTDPLTLGGSNYPQTPMRVKLGSWCGGCKGEPQGTVEWAGGPTTFDNAPYVMYVESVAIQNYNPGSYYIYGDKSGSWQSIQVVKGSSGGSTVSAQPSGSVQPSSVVGNQTMAPTKSIPVSHIMNTGAAVSTTVKASNGTTKTVSGSAGSGGRPMSTHTSLVTTSLPNGGQPTAGGANPSESGAASSSAVPNMQNSATSLGITTSGCLLGVLLGFVML